MPNITHIVPYKVTVIIIHYIGSIWILLFITVLTQYLHSLCSYIMLKYVMTVMIDDYYRHSLHREYTYTYIHYILGLVMS